MTVGVVRISVPAIRNPVAIAVAIAMIVTLAVIPSKSNRLRRRRRRDTLQCKLENYDRRTEAGPAMAHTMRRANASLILSRRQHENEPSHLLCLIELRAGTSSMRRRSGFST